MFLSFLVIPQPCRDTVFPCLIGGSGSFLISALLVWVIPQKIFKEKLPDPSFN